MDLYEYQARDLFERHGVPVLAGIVATTPSDARAAAAKIGGSRKERMTPGWPSAPHQS